LETKLNLDPDSNPEPESDAELITDPDPNLQIIPDLAPDAQHWQREHAANHVRGKFGGGGGGNVFFGPINRSLHFNMIIYFDN
jgi:hypothetical protein